jgi:hypothetical protein
VKNWPQSVKTVGLMLLIIYIPVIAYLGAHGVYQDSVNLGREQMVHIGSVIVQPENGIDKGMFIELFLVYVVRVGVLIGAFFLLSEAKRYRMLKATLLACLIPEFLMWKLAFPSYQGPSSGPFSNSGWGSLALYVVLILSTLVQFVTMAVCASLAVKTQPNGTARV